MHVFVNTYVYMSIHKEFTFLWNHYIFCTHHSTFLLDLVKRAFCQKNLSRHLHHILTPYNIWKELNKQLLEFIYISSISDHPYIAANPRWDMRPGWYVNAKPYRWRGSVIHSIIHSVCCERRFLGQPPTPSSLSLRLCTCCWTRPLVSLPQASRVHRIFRFSSVHSTRVVFPFASQRHLNRVLKL